MTVCSSPTEICMPEPITLLYQAQKSLREFYAHTKLKFTLDGRLVGDIGEVLASKKFGIELSERRIRGVDGHVDGRTVQIKATQFRDQGPAFTPGEGVADHLIFLCLDFEKAKAEVIYNGPEYPIRQMLPRSFTGTKRVPLGKVMEAAAQLSADE